MVTETDRNKARSAVVSAYHALDCVGMSVPFLHAFADAAVDAVSTDAEPVEWQYFCDGKWRHSTNPVFHRETGYPMRPLYAEPVKTAPAVAVKAIKAVWKYSLVIESSVRRGDGPDQYAGVTEALRLVKDARSALSAQVQDVAGSFIMPIGWKRAVVDELKKSRAEFMISDFEIAERIREALEAASHASKHGDAE